jgi:exodeoxyribonuclease-3
LRVFTLNIRHGGGSRVEKILDEIKAIAADTVVLTEFRNNRAGGAIRNGLTATGYECQFTFDTTPSTNTVLIASRAKPTSTDAQRSAQDWSSNRHLAIEFGWGNLVAVYLPPGRVKIPAWDSLLLTAKELAGAPTILIGDFNTGKHRIDEVGATFIAPEYMDRLEGASYTDTWRFKNPDRLGATWRSTHNDFRLDYAFLSAPISGFKWDVRHEDRTRTLGTSDHTAVVLDIDLETH